jgi:prolyl oligopeptidase
MNRTLGAAVSLLACLSFGQDPSLQPRQGPPRTRTDNVQEVLHGVTVTDPYRWLEDQNSPETRAWIQEENSYTHSFLDRWPGRQRVEKS